MEDDTVVAVAVRRSGAEKVVLSVFMLAGGMSAADFFVGLLGGG